MAVRVQPGLTVFTVTPVRASAFDRLTVMLLSPALAAQYSGTVSGGEAPPPLEMLITRPQPRCCMAGTKAWTIRTAAMRFCCIAPAQCPGLTSNQPLSPPPVDSVPPMLLTRMSISPVAAATAALPSSVARSPRAMPALPPPSRIACATASVRAASRPWTTTSAPSCASAIAMPLPMPELLPVTSARLPSS